MRPIPYGRQEITEDDIASVSEVLKSDFLTQGPKVSEFESAFADYTGSKYAIAVSNGTAALHLAALTLGVKEGTRVITTPITVVASANCIRYCGGEIFFVDIDPDSYLIDLKKTEELIKSKPTGFFSGIIPVNLAGHPVHVDELKRITDKYNLWIIEDACHSPGAEFHGQESFKSGDGKYADMTVFSFHPVKHIACGEGGMITTNNEAFYKHLISLRSHGITRDHLLLEQNHGGWYYEMQELGYNYRLTDIQAALGLSQLKRLAENIKIRNSIAQYYNSKLQHLPVKLPAAEKNVVHAFHLYIIRTKKRRELYDFMRMKNIFCQVHYFPVHLMPYYHSLGWKKGDFPFAENYYEECLSLPLFPSLTLSELEYIIDVINIFFNEHS